LNLGLNSINRLRVKNDEFLLVAIDFSDPIRPVRIFFVHFIDQRKFICAINPAAGFQHPELSKATDFSEKNLSL
jgi:hypothetical protein